MFRKALQAAGLWVIVAVVIYFVQPRAFAVPQLWVLIVVGICANALQPSYNPFEKSRTPEDRGTALQILWTVYGAQALALAMFLAWFAPLAFDAISSIGAAGMVGGLALRTWSVYTLGKWFTWNVEVQRDQQLITGGPYRFVRHPSYTGAFITFSCVGILFHAYLASVIAAAALFLAFRRRIRHEEALLSETFPEYRAYMETTGGLFPRIRSKIKNSTPA